MPVEEPGGTGGGAAAYPARRLYTSVTGHHPLPPNSDPEVGETPDDGQALDISVASLASLDDLVGFFQQTFLSNSGLETVLSHFLSQIGAFEIEYIGGHILIEQGNTSSLGLDDIGLWTNVLQDGSVISVVGQADLIDDVSWLLA